MNQLIDDDDPAAAAAELEACSVTYRAKRRESNFSDNKENPPPRKID